MLFVIKEDVTKPWKKSFQGLGFVFALILVGSLSWTIRSWNAIMNCPKKKKKKIKCEVCLPQDILLAYAKNKNRNK